MAAWYAVGDMRSDSVTPEPDSADADGPGEVPERDFEVLSTAL
jgi:hypothetical protein